MLLVVTTGCASPPARNPVPTNLIADATIPGVADFRYWGDSKQADFKEWFRASDESVQKHYGGIYGKEHHYLALSGGGQKGAFGAGLLAGWTAHGDRPQFDIVSGVSTGALTAPYAFSIHYCCRIFRHLQNQTLLRCRVYIEKIPVYLLSI